MATLVETLGALAEKWNFESLRTELQRLKTDPWVAVGFLGDFNSGKSSLINAFVGVEGLMPMSAKPCTAVSASAMAVAGLTEPAFYQELPEGTLEPIDRDTFRSMATGKVAGQPCVHLPPRRGFPADFALLDTAGLNSLLDEHTAKTLGRLPFLDAAVLCVNIELGGLTASTVAFLKSPGVRHLQSRFLIALTHADLLDKDRREKIRRKAIQELSQLTRCGETAAAERVLIVSAQAGDTEELQSAMERLVERQRSALAAERLERAAGRLVPHAMELLEQQRGALEETDQEFEERREKLEASIESLKNSREQHRRRLDELQATLRKEVQGVCERHRHLLAEAKDEEALEAATRGFSDALSMTLQAQIEQFTAGFTGDVSGLVGSVKRSLGQINRGAEVGKQAVSAALFAMISGGTSLGANAAEAGAGALITRMGAKAAAKQTIKQGLLAKLGQGALAAINAVNPVTYAGDWIAERIKLKQLDALLGNLSAVLSGQACRTIEAWYEREHFEPTALELSGLKQGLEQAEKERRQDLNRRSLRLSALAADVSMLQAAHEQQAL